MESPVKKLDFAAAGKENMPLDADFANLEAEMDAKHMENKASQEVTKTVVAAPKSEELLDEPLLRENAQRFVLFPIKYHEVSNASSPRRVEWIAC
jgi:ribonucleoside-diphosphate reductase subunit M2